MARDLDSIIHTGHFEFEFFECIYVTLQYYPYTTMAPIRTSNSKEILPQTLNEKGLRVQKWSKQQIDDFVTKLGFLDAEKDGGNNVKKFLHLNEVILSSLKGNKLFIHLYPLPRSPVSY